MTSPAQRLQLARERAGYRTGTDAARAFGWKASTYLGHENGSRGLRKDAAQRYARAFGVQWTWLIGGQGEEPEKPTASDASKLFQDVERSHGRPTLIMLSSLVDQNLERSILSKLPNASATTVDQLFGRGGTASSPAAKLTLASALGAITEREHATIAQILDLRNIATHHSGDDLLEQPEIQAKLRHIVSSYLGATPKDEAPIQLVLKFGVVASTLALVLAGGSRTAAAEELRSIAEDLSLPTGDA